MNFTAIKVYYKICGKNDQTPQEVMVQMFLLDLVIMDTLFSTNTSLHALPLYETKPAKQRETPLYPPGCADVLYMQIC
jgi:hypothetical protein